MGTVLVVNALVFRVSHLFVYVDVILLDVVDDP